MRVDRAELVGLGANSWVRHVLGTLGCYTEGFIIGIAVLVLVSIITVMKYDKKNKRIV